MILSRAEIAAAVSAYLDGGRNRTARPPMRDTAARARLADALLPQCAQCVIERPIYRDSLVLQLQQRVAAGTYRASADAIVEQLLGRLIAAKLPM